MHVCVATMIITSSPFKMYSRDVVLSYSRKFFRSLKRFLCLESFAIHDNGSNKQAVCFAKVFHLHVLVFIVPKIASKQKIAYE